MSKAQRTVLAERAGVRAEVQANRAMELWGITDGELQKIQRSLAELG